MNQGWVKIHRTMLDWEWFNDSKTLHLFMYLLLKANHEQRSYHGITIKRGELLTGRKKMAKETGLSEQSIRTSIKRLKSTSELTIKSTSKYSLINIVNYELYQAKDDKTNHQINQQSNQQVTSNQPTTNHKQECKELKELKKTSNVVNKLPTIDVNSESFKIAQTLFNNILLKNPKNKKPNMNSWALDVDKIIRIDNRTPSEVKRVLNYLKDDDFWSGTILSPIKLRKHFDGLLIKMNSNVTNSAAPYNDEHEKKAGYAQW